MQTIKIMKEATALLLQVEQTSKNHRDTVCAAVVVEALNSMRLAIATYKETEMLDGIQAHALALEAIAERNMETNKMNHEQRIQQQASIEHALTEYEKGK